MELEETIVSGRVLLKYMFGCFPNLYEKEEHVGFSPIPQGLP